VKITKLEQLKKGAIIWVNGPVRYVNREHLYCGPARIVDLTYWESGKFAFCKIAFPIPLFSYADEYLSEKTKPFTLEEVLESRMEINDAQG